MRARRRWHTLAALLVLLCCLAPAAESCEARRPGEYFEHPRCSLDVPITPLGDLGSRTALVLEDTIDAHTGPLLYSFVVPDSEASISFRATTCNPATTFDTLILLWPGIDPTAPAERPSPLATATAEEANAAGDDDARCTSSPLASTLERELAPGPYTLSVSSAHAYIGAVPGSFHLTLRGSPHEHEPAFHHAVQPRARRSSAGAFTVSIELCPSTRPDADSASGSPVLAVAWSSSRGLLGVAAAWLGGLVGHSARFAVSAAKAHPTRADVVTLVGRVTEEYSSTSLASLAAGLRLSPPVPRFGGVRRLTVIETCYRSHSDKKATCVPAIEHKHEDPPPPPERAERHRTPHHHAAPEPHPAFPPPAPAAPAPAPAAPAAAPPPVPHPPPAPPSGGPSPGTLAGLSFLACLVSGATLALYYRRAASRGLPTHHPTSRVPSFKAKAWPQNGVYPGQQAPPGARRPSYTDQRRDSLGGIPPALITPRRQSLANPKAAPSDPSVPDPASAPQSFFSLLSSALTGASPRGPAPAAEHAAEADGPAEAGEKHAVHLVRSPSGRWMQLARSSSGRLGKMVRSASGRMGTLPRSLSAGSSGVAAGVFAALSRAVSRRSSIADSAKLGESSGDEAGASEDEADIGDLPEPLEAVQEGDERDSEISSRRTSRRGSVSAAVSRPGSILSFSVPPHPASVSALPIVTIDGPPPGPVLNRRASLAGMYPSSRSASFLHTGSPRAEAGVGAGELQPVPGRVSPSAPPPRARSFSFDSRQG
eukprot:tig00000870_g5121.t1